MSIGVDLTACFMMIGGLGDTDPDCMTRKEQGKTRSQMTCQTIQTYLGLLSLLDPLEAAPKRGSLGKAGL